MHKEKNGHELSRVKMNLTNTPYFSSPAHSSLTDHFRKKAEAAAWARKENPFRPQAILLLGKVKVRHQEHQSGERSLG